jgi:hypothetical protein
VRADDDRNRSARVSIRLAGSKKSARARGGKTVRVGLKSRARVRRSAKVIVRYRLGGTTVRAVVRLGKTVTVSPKR